MTGPGTLKLRARMTAQARRQVERFGHDLTLVVGTGSTTWGTPASTLGVTQAVRGVLMPAPLRRMQATGASGLPVPSYVAYLAAADVEADLSTPGWYLQHQGQNFYPTRDARDEGGQGVVWVCELGSPGEVTVRGEDQPGWAG
ncbi:hypothetical protein [Deinococcus navajonensis]|uniref:Uncharacterized protein n=1 Tax=Deinococcus navajonensis TaxID=309884 RepID=A0ABV8XTE9_9DEIO